MQETAKIFDSISLLQCYDIDKSKQRYGSARDGGYIFTNDISPNAPIISFGVAENCDFEYEMAERGHQVYMYDYSVEGPVKSHNNFKFQKLKLSGHENLSEGVTSLPAIVQRLGLENRTDLILKMDIEGSEYEILSQCPPKVIKQFEQIAVEVHFLLKLNEPEFRKNFDNAFNALKKDFTLFHVHANNHSPLSTVGGTGYLNPAGGLLMADVLELSYIRSDCAKRKANNTIYPTHLDTPNHPHHPDHLLFFYPFSPGSEDLRDRLRMICQVNDLNYALAMQE